jgi:hypothetical protein
MKFELKEWVGGASDDELLDDMRRCAKAFGKDTITGSEYEDIGKAHPDTIRRRFGSWSKALTLAGLRPHGGRRGITDEELFENIKSLWISLGRQPGKSEVKKPSSLFSVKPYQNRFGTWTAALKAFVLWINSDCPEESPQEAEGSDNASDLAVQRTATKRRTRCEISERQRFRVLVRDGFRCGTCGASPLTQRGIELHVDHIVPWTRGGETRDDNLETKCKRCNLGKGNAFNV